MGYRMIFSDMDGTLLRGTSELSYRNQTMIQRAMKQGIDFIICTGRGIYGVEPFLKQLNAIGQKGYVICQNGAAIYDLQNIEIVRKHNFTADDLRPVIELARKVGVTVYLYDDRNFMVEKETPMVREYCKVMRVDMRILPDGLSYEGNFTKCLLEGSPEKLAYIQETTKSAVQNKLNSFYSSATYLEFVKTGVSKGRALQETVAEAGVALSDVIAIGDSDNDLSMIQTAGLGIAVANGQPHVKAAADYITKANCDQDAVAEAIAHFIFGETLTEI